MSNKSEKFKNIVYNEMDKSVGTPKLTYDAVISAGGINFKAMAVHSITRTARYTEDITTIINLTVLVQMSEARLLLARAHGSIVVNLTTQMGDRRLIKETLYGVVQGNLNADTANTTRELGMGDTLSVSTVTFELMSHAVWKLRASQVGGSFEKTSALEVARFLLARTIDNESGEVGGVSSLLVDLTEEQTQYNNIVVPDGTEFLAVFDYLQKHYGIYPNGLGVFHQLKTWYFFQPFKADRYNTENAKLIVYCLNNDDIAQPDKTFRMDNDVYYIAVAGTTGMLDNIDANALNDKTGFRVGSIRSLEGRNVNYGGEVLQTTPEGFMSQSNPTNHKSGIVNAGIVKERFKDDDKSIRSTLAKNRGTFIKVVWNMSMPNVLRPGMPTRFMYANDAKIITRHGTLIGELYHTAVDGGNVSNRAYSSQTELLFWLSS